MTFRNWTVFYGSTLTSNLFQVLHVEENLCNVLGESAWEELIEDRFVAIFKWQYFLRTVFLLLLFNLSFVSVYFVFCWPGVGCVCSRVCYSKQGKGKQKGQSDRHYNEQKFRLHHMKKQTIYYLMTLLLCRGLKLEKKWRYRENKVFVCVNAS